MERLESLEDWTEAQRHRIAVLYKHSPICGLSHLALPQVERFVEARPDIPVYAVNVIRERAVSNRIAEDMGVRHESPQVILLSSGQVRWHASHRGVTTDGILQALALAAGATDREVQ